MDLKSSFQSKPLLFVVIVYSLGLLFGQQFLNPGLSLALLIICFGLLLFIRRDQLFLSIFLLVVFAGGWYYTAITTDTLNQLVNRIEALNETTVDFEGQITEVRYYQNRTRLTVKWGHLKSPDEVSVIKIGFQLYVRDRFEVAVGDSVSGKGELRKIGGKRNPGDFDFRKFYFRNGIFCRIYTETENVIARKPGESFSPLRIFSDIQTYIKKNLTQSIGPESGLLSALILGDKSQIDPELKQTFVRTGVVHVLAVSGLHVGFILVILISIVRLFRIPWGWDRLLLILGLCFYVGLTGGKPSVIRASIMAGLYLIAPVVNRPANIWNIIALAALSILIVNPFALQDLGFLFSFSAVISIIVLYNQFQKILPLWCRVNTINNQTLKYSWGLFLVSLSAQLGTLPLTALYFHRIPVIALIANVMIVPLVGVLLANGFLILILGGIPVIGALVGQSAWFITQLIQSLTNTFSKVSFASIQTGSIQPYSVIIYFSLLAGIFLILQPGFRRKAVILFLLAGNLVVWKNAISNPGCEVLFIDVGEGDAAVIKMRNGKAMLIDGGLRTQQKDYGEKTIIPVLQYLGIHRLNWLVATHPHNDHIGGLITVTESLPVDTVWELNANFNSATNNRLNELFLNKGVVVQYPHSGDLKYLSNQCLVQFFSPVKGFKKNVGNINNQSLVFKISFGKTSIFFPGDLELEGEAIILPYGDLLRADLLKVAHHGSLTSTTRPFLKLINPELAVVSVGYRNKFHHPAPVILKRIMNSGAKIHRTDQQGALWVRTDGKTFGVINWK
ncbi:MAG: DNA internalization-related competence protein ComEC/Rec2 [Fidelibacterota bacterium]